MNNKSWHFKIRGYRNIFNSTSLSYECFASSHITDLLFHFVYLIYRLHNNSIISIILYVGNYFALVCVSALCKKFVFVTHIN